MTFTRISVIIAVLAAAVFGMAHAQQDQTTLNGDQMIAGKNKQIHLRGDVYPLGHGNSLVVRDDWVLVTERNDLDDEAITEVVYSLMDTHLGVDPFSVNVSTRGGIVSLDGWVDSSSEAHALISIIEQIPGVQEIDAESLLINPHADPLVSPGGSVGGGVG